MPHRNLFRPRCHPQQKQVHVFFFFYDFAFFFLSFPFFLDKDNIQLTQKIISDNFNRLGNEFSNQSKKATIMKFKFEIFLILILYISLTNAKERRSGPRMYKHKRRGNYYHDRPEKQINFGRSYSVDRIDHGTPREINNKLRACSETAETIYGELKNRQTHNNKLTGTELLKMKQLEENALCVHENVKKQVSDMNKAYKPAHDNLLGTASHFKTLNGSGDANTLPATFNGMKGMYNDKFQADMKMYGEVKLQIYRLRKYSDIIMPRGKHFNKELFYKNEKVNATDIDSFKVNDIVVVRRNKKDEWQEGIVLSFEKPEVRVDRWSSEYDYYRKIVYSVEEEKFHDAREDPEDIFYDTMEEETFDYNWRNYQKGDHVYVRRNKAEEWRLGTVVKTSQPVVATRSEYNATFYSFGFTWKFIAPLQDIKSKFESEVGYKIEDFVNFRDDNETDWSYGQVVSLFPMKVMNLKWTIIKPLFVKPMDKKICFSLKYLTLPSGWNITSTRRHFTIF
jgi:hypothetical protein